MSVPADSPPLMTVAEVARGLHVGRMTVNRMIHRRQIRAARVGKLWRIPASEFERLATPAEIATNTTSAEPVQAAYTLNSQGQGVANGTNGLGEGMMRFLKHRPWETTPAASSVAGSGRTARTKKAASQRH